MFLGRGGVWGWQERICIREVGVASGETCGEEVR